MKIIILIAFIITQNILIGQINALDTSIAHRHELLKQRLENEPFNDEYNPITISKYECVQHPFGKGLFPSNISYFRHKVDELRDWNTGFSSGKYKGGLLGGIAYVLRLNKPYWTTNKPDHGCNIELNWTLSTKKMNVTEFILDELKVNFFFEIEDVKDSVEVLILKTVDSIRLKTVGYGDVYSSGNRDILNDSIVNLRGNNLGGLISYIEVLCNKIVMDETQDEIEELQDGRTVRRHYYHIIFDRKLASDTEQLSEYLENTYGLRLSKEKREVTIKHINFRF